MAINASGPCSLPLAGLAALLAACPTFQAKVGAANAAAALRSIHYPIVDVNEPIESDEETDEPEYPARPWAIITDDDAAQFEYDDFGRSSGSVILTLEFVSHPDYPVKSRSSFQDFCNAIGAILVEMMERRNTPAPDGSQYWNARKFTRLVAPSLCDERREEASNVPGELFFEVAFLVEWD
ncbi:MAG: hypothetical protein V4719_26635 [Planctomycetota bacterium]